MLYLCLFKQGCGFLKQAKFKAYIKYLSPDEFKTWLTSNKVVGCGNIFVLNKSCHVYIIQIFEFQFGQHVYQKYE